MYLRNLTYQIIHVIESPNIYTRNSFKTLRVINCEEIGHSNCEPFEIILLASRLASWPGFFELSKGVLRGTSKPTFRISYLTVCPHKNTNFFPRDVFLYRFSTCQARLIISIRKIYWCMTGFQSYVVKPTSTPDQN